MAQKLCPNEITGLLKDGGKVSLALPHYQARQAQLDLAEFLTRAFNEDSIVAAEAGTGVGKSFAYLVPAAIFAQKNGGKKEKIVISTATITLQKQLFEKDIPLVTRALGGGGRGNNAGGKNAGGKNAGDLKVILMKGRRNYVCRRRLADALKEPVLHSRDADELKRIDRWAEGSKTGEKDTLSFLPDESLWAGVCSESDSCMGSKCQWRESCFVIALRKRALDAHIIVVNHHLLFADLALRRDSAGTGGDGGGSAGGNASVLPAYSRLIIDEAHSIENAATSFFSQDFSLPGILHLLGRLYNKRGRAQKQTQGGLLVRLLALLPSHNGGVAESVFLKKAQALMEKVRKSAQALQDAALWQCGREGALRLSPYSQEQYAKIESDLFPDFAALGNNIGDLNRLVKKELESLDENAAEETCVWETNSVLRSLEAVAMLCALFMEYRERQGDVFWLEKRQSKSGAQALPFVNFIRTPLNMAGILGDWLFAPNQTVVCVSATLTVNNDFAYWADRCGINCVKDRVFLNGTFPSPFPYSSAVLLAAPSDAPDPAFTSGKESWQDFVNRAVAGLAAIAGGSALVLFTSYQSLQSAWFSAVPHLEGLGIRCFKQGDDDRTRLLENFLADKSSVLFATDSFWEGVDAPGETLRLVILCRLPFKSPGDPVFEARLEAVEKSGGNSFMELSLPQAAMKFKQGFGRLMRRESDSGVVAVLDSRLVKKRYGQLFLQSLPETKTCFADFANVLRQTERFLSG
ncbi:MAG: ATP-dependent DNA helicase DinG [Spirochaetes bacterium]|nr:ATP-dependent DNA helicase DinG [Spirochaetota bacterium]